ncbi:MAG: hypothetical protein Q9191_000697 [Dirinaria sp. TL-2023a]
MVAANRLLRIFWPSDLTREKSLGTIVGWKNGELDLFVVSLLQDVEPRNVYNAISAGILLRNSPHPIGQILELCRSSSIHVLGVANPDPPAARSDLNLVVAHTDPSSTFPRILCPKYEDLTIQIVMFDRPSPRRMQYMSLEPISLALGDKFLVDDVSGSSLDAEGMDSKDSQTHRNALVDKLRLHTVIKHPATRKELVLPTILNQINCSAETAQLLERNRGLLGPRPKRTLSVGERVVESATTLWDLSIDGLWHFLTVWVYPLLIRAFIIGLICHRMVAEVVLRVLQWRLRTDSLALRDVSATAQQIDIRLQQFCYWPIQYLTLRRRKNEWESITDRHPDYIRFYNSLWLVANDVIIGIALGSYIIDNADWVAWQINSALSVWTVAGLHNMISWLMDWPAGLKLNNELARFLGDLFLWVIDYWAGGSTKPRAV